MADSGREIAIAIDSVYQEGKLSEQAVRALGRAQVDPSVNMGLVPADFLGDEGLLVTVMPDDSASLNTYVQRSSPSPVSPSFMLEGERKSGLVSYKSERVPADDPRANAEAERFGHNTVVDALRESPNPNSVLFCTRTLNGNVINPYSTLDRVRKLDMQNFRPYGETPLYDQTAVLLKMVLAKYGQFQSDYKTARTATLIISDGKDQASRTQTPESVAAIINDMRTKMGDHIIAAMGIDDGKTDFRRVFADMGIDPKWILTTGATKEEIQEAFRLFAKKASEATVAANFDRMLTAGFTELSPV